MTSRGIRNNNPGNLDYNQAMYREDPWLGETGIELHARPRFTTFRNPAFGIRALCKVLLTYHRHRKAADGSAIDTVQEVIDRWAPPSENNTDAYASHVRDLLDVERGGIIDIEAPEVLLSLATAIIDHENGEQPYDVDTLHAGVRMALA